MDFWNRFLFLCNERKVSPSKACEQNNIASSILVRWRNGSIPHNATQQKLATYFGVSTDILLGKEEYIPMPKAEDCPPEVPVLECQRLRDLISLIATCNEKQCEEIFKFTLYVKGK